MMSSRKTALQTDQGIGRQAAAPFKAARTAAHRLWISAGALFSPVCVERLEHFLIFAGYPRSGSSTLGSFLDAHSQMLVAHELNVLKHVQRGYGRGQIFALIARNSRRFADSGRNSTGYKGLVEGQYNGRSAQPRVIGDKKAGRTALLLAQDGMLLDRLQETVRLPLKCLHLVRNPFDMITTHAYGGNNRRKQITPEVFDLTCREFFDRFDAMERLISSGRFDVKTLRYEDLLDDPAGQLESLISWLGVESDAAWREACCAHLFRSAHKSRSRYPWSAEEIRQLIERISRYDFLRGYTFDN